MRREDGRRRIEERGRRKRKKDRGRRMEEEGRVSLLVPWPVRGQEFALPFAPARGAGRSRRVWPNLALHQ